MNRKALGPPGLYPVTECDYSMQENAAANMATAPTRSQINAAKLRQMYATDRVMQKMKLQRESLFHIAATACKTWAGSSSERISLLPHYRTLLNSQDVNFQILGASEIRQTILNSPMTTMPKDFSLWRDLLCHASGPRMACSALHNECVWSLSLLLNRDKDYSESINALETGKNGALAAAPLNTAAIIKLFIDILAEEDICTDAMITIGQLARESVALRDQCIQAGAVAGILQALQRNNTLTNYRAGVYAFSRLCTGKPRPKLEAIAPCFPVLVTLSSHSDAKIVQYVRDAFISSAAVVSAGNRAEIQEALDAGCIKALAQWLKTCDDNSVKKDVCMALNNAISVGSDEQVQNILRELREDILVPEFVRFLDTHDADISSKIVDSMGNILKVESSPLANCFVESGGVSKLLALSSNSENAQLRTKACRLLNTFFLPQQKEKEEDHPIMTDGLQ